MAPASSTALRSKGSAIASRSRPASIEIGTTRRRTAASAGMSRTADGSVGIGLSSHANPQASQRSRTDPAAAAFSSASTAGELPEPDSAITSATMTGVDHSTASLGAGLSPSASASPAFPAPLRAPPS